VNIHVINPLVDSRWNELVNSHPRASAFHSQGWLQALAHSYKYEPVALTTEPAAEPLQNAVLFCRVSSWITGRRLVSVPFADHCDPLLARGDEMGTFVEWLQAHCGWSKYRYAELRPSLQSAIHGLQPRQSFWLHNLDLSPTIERLFEGLHKDSIQRKIRRAVKEGLVCESGRTARHLDEFYTLLLKTKRRHRLFPQPRSWFQDLLHCLGDKTEIRIAKKGDIPVAAMLTIREGSTVIYKYGCSDEKYHQLGSMPFLFWTLIEESKAAGAAALDLGRSDLDREGLITFKDRFGAARRPLHYYRVTGSNQSGRESTFNPRLMGRLISILPDMALTTGGRWLYRHMG
jgi:CelD/BcsL family acetyltransferase involved in cellulose biosynthesis